MKLPKFSLSTNIVIGLCAGLACGLFFGEICADLEIVGNGFVRLLQMTILPYIVVSLIHGIGSLTYEHAKLLAKRGGLLLCVFWSIGLTVVLTMPLAFPQWTSGSFFSKSSVEPAKRIDYLDLYIPSNPFHALANNVIPAVVLFSICVGIALIGMPNKDHLIKNLETFAQALTRLTHAVVKLTPIGVFALAASAAGTMTIEEVGRLQVYFTTYILAALVMTFWILPALVMTFTPFRYRDIVGASKDALITGFTTGNLFVVLPVVEKNIKQLFEKQQRQSEQTGALVDIITPVYFNFPDTGKLLSLLFIPFAAWFTGGGLSLSQYPDFAFTGFVTFFGGVDIAIPFLLNSFQLPSDLFHLYIVAGILNGRFSTLLATMDLITFTFLCTCALTGLFTFKIRRVVVFGAITLGVFVCVLTGARLILARTVKNTHFQEKKLALMTLSDPVPANVLTKPGEAKSHHPPAGLSRLDFIRERKILRVGYNPDNLPFCYFNAKNELVGFDIEMAHRLAKDLGCSLELVPFANDTLSDQLSRSDFDVAMSGLTVSVPGLLRFDYTEPTMSLTLGFVVKDYRKEKFQSQKSLERMKNLTIAIVKTFSDVEQVKEYIPKATIVTIDSNEDFFRGKVKADVLLTSAEKGSVWTLVFPSYSVAIPKPLILKMNAAYAIAKGDQEFLDFLNQWLALMKLNGFVDDKYDKWILGKTAPEEKTPRWCVLRDVLDCHWGDDK